jgi:DNA repair protein SbcC/Rad50
LILQELTLQNFRSYGETPTKIEFDRGLLLFEGDIGSGKSTILYAIEFALFGLGELEARSILRSSANAAKVELAFVVRDQEYKISRTIERKKGVKTTTIQTRGWIEEPGGKITELSPTELKSRVLQILSFKEKQSAKASSRIYRYAIFTPQELMKEVLAQKSEDRLDTLRRAFGVEDYSFAASNSDIVLGELKKQIQIYSKLSENLPRKESELETRRKELSSLESKLCETEKGWHETEISLNDAKLQLEELEKHVRIITSLQALVPFLETNLSQLQKQFSETRSDLQRNRRTFQEIEVAERKLAHLKQDYEDYLATREKLRELDALSNDLRKLENEISKSNLLIASKEAELKADIDSNRDQQRKIRDTILAYQNEINFASSVENEARLLREKAGSLSDLQNQLEELRSEIGSIQALLGSRNSRIDDIERKMRTLDGISKESVCPLCGQSLDAVHLRNVDEEYQSELLNLRNEESSYRAKLEGLDSDLRALEGKREDSRIALYELQKLEERLARIQQLKISIQNWSAELVKLESSSEKTNATLLMKKFAEESRSFLSDALTKKEELTSSLAEYENLRSHYLKLEDSQITEEYQSALAASRKKTEVLEQVTRLENKSDELEKLITQSSIEVAEKRRELEQAEPTLLRYGQVKEKVESLERAFSNLNSEVQVIREKVRGVQEEEQKLSSEVNELQGIAKLVSKSKGTEVWLSENFLPAIADIERYILASINEEFSQVFLRIFSILTVEEGDLSAKVDDRFTPIIEQGGYELDVQSLSGGERTAVALAYRLALNYMVKRANEALQTNLLILDEPTEGFSKEQIYRFRNALEELASDQVIIVSHERDLEPMADRVYRVEKANGESIVVVVSP